MHQSRRPVIAGNWKMNHGGRSGCVLAQAIARGARKEWNADVVVAPPFTALAAVAHELEGSSVALAAQNFYPQPDGAFTGEISGPMLQEAGCGWVIVGHSERRQLFGERDASVAVKVARALELGLVPIVCVGETLEEREAARTLAVVGSQLDAFVQQIAVSPGVAVVAYEPVWAIGTGRVAGPEQAQEVHAMLRQRLAQTSSALAQATRILYGGSVKADNAAALFACPDVDGALIGGASLNADGFLAIAAASQ